MIYKNKSSQTQELIGFGVVEPNKTIQTDKKINNPNFELVNEKLGKKGK
jgi:hypothetical protein